MARLAPRLAVLAAAALSLGACEQQLQPEKSVEYRPEEVGTVDHAMCLLGFAAVPLRELSSGHHLVDATVNGRKATFILDTGANLSVVHAPEAKGMGLPEKGQPTGALGLGGGMKAQQVVLERMEIGGIPIRRNRIMTSDLSQLVHVLGQMSRNRIAGIIGQDVMKEHRAVIDVARPILFLIARDQDPAPVDAARCRKSGGEGEGDADGNPPIRSG
ncbi:MAG TPA: retropepsin-like aspartic protease [Allosphingosinicella sp.]|nr:retropepsin-like aspartic protease [Allosphingosinicella sp.]